MIGSRQGGSGHSKVDCVHLLYVICPAPLGLGLGLVLFFVFPRVTRFFSPARAPPRPAHTHIDTLYTAE